MKTLLTLPLVMLISTLCFSQNAQKQSPKQADEIKVDEPEIHFKMVDENGNEMKFIMTYDEYDVVANKIRDYEKSQGIKNRTKNLYVINSKYEVVSVTEQKN